MGVRERRKTFFHEKKSFSPLPEPLSSFQKKRGILLGEILLRWEEMFYYLSVSETWLFKKAGYFVGEYLPGWETWLFKKSGVFC